MSAEDYIGNWDDMNEMDDSITNEQDEKDYIQMLHDGNCVAEVVLKKNSKTGKLFWGCSSFPNHRWAHKRMK